MKRRCTSSSLYCSFPWELCRGWRSLSWIGYHRGTTPECIDFFRCSACALVTGAYIARKLYQIFHHATGFEQRQSALLNYGNRQLNGRVLQDCNHAVDDAIDRSA